jgi:hypothetical protein
VTLQRARSRTDSAMQVGVFAYNEVPTIAVAKRLLVLGASRIDAPFFFLRVFLIQLLKASR